MREGDSSLPTIPQARTALTEPEARSLTGQIRSLGEAIADRVDLLVDRIRQAREGEAHTALGYKTWTEYVSTEFAGVLPRLEREPRRELVAALTATGMSTRAIAPVAGVSQKTVDRDARAGESHDSPELGPALATVSASSVEQKIAAIPTNNVVGIDGKSYPRPEPRKERRPSRSPLPESDRRAVDKQVGQTRDQRADIIREMAAQGYSSRQMPGRVGVAEATVRLIARDFGINIPADKAIGKTRRIDSNRIAREIVQGMEGTRMSLELINYDVLDREEAAHWDAALGVSFEALTRFRKQIKEMCS